MRKLLILFASLVLMSACSNESKRLVDRLPSPRDLPFIHKIDIQQGNVVTQDMVAQLQPHMDKKKVQFIMGTPIVKDTFNANRWDYIYTYEYGGGDIERRLVTLVFNDEGKLDHIEGDVIAASGPLIADLHHDMSVKVPGFKKRTFMDRVKDNIPFTGDPEEDESNAGDTTDDTVASAENTDAKEEEAEEEVVFDFEQVEPEDPYTNIQAAPGEGIVVPPDAPRAGREKGFFGKLFDSIGIGAGADEDELPEEETYDEGAPEYRDITDQNEV